MVQSCGKLDAIATDGHGDSEHLRCFVAAALTPTKLYTITYKIRSVALKKEKFTQ